MFHRLRGVRPAAIWGRSNRGRPCHFDGASWTDVNNPRKGNNGCLLDLEYVNIHAEGELAAILSRSCHSATQAVVARATTTHARC